MPMYQLGCLSNIKLGWFLYVLIIDKYVTFVNKFVIYYLSLYKYFRELFTSVYL